MKTFNNKIALNLDGDAEVSVKGFIAPIEYSLIRNFHVEWDDIGKPVALLNQKNSIPPQFFYDFLPTGTAVSVGECLGRLKHAGATGRC